MTSTQKEAHLQVNVKQEDGESDCSSSWCQETQLNAEIKQEEQETDWTYSMYEDTELKVEVKQEDEEETNSSGFQETQLQVEVKHEDEEKDFSSSWFELSARLFYAKRGTVVVPAHPAISDDEDPEEEEDNMADPDPHPEFFSSTYDLYTPQPGDEGISAKRKRMQPAVEVLEDEEDDDIENNNEDKDQPVPHPMTSTKKRKLAARQTTWKKIDLDNPSLPEYLHFPPDFVGTPFHYFRRYFSPQVISHITYQTNLYASQRDVNTTFTTTEEEMMHFVAILIYMGIAELPSIDDYWAVVTRVPQIANLMSSKRFRLMNRIVHFNDNTQVPGTIDRFFKIRPLFNFLNRAFRSEPQTPKQSVDEIMVAYKDKTTGNLRQYIKNKLDKRGIKLFARASQDGFIHDIVLYQGKTTLEAHDVPITPEQEAMDAPSQIVAALAKTMSTPSISAIFAGNFFTSLELVRYLKDRNCRYTGTASNNRVGMVPLQSIEEMEMKAVPCGTFDYVTSDDGILALRWKDNKIVTVLSTDMGVQPLSSVCFYCSDTKRKEEVSCPAVIKSYSVNMSGIEKSDMLVHLFRTPMKSKRWYMQLFAFAIDVSLTNAWIMYKRDCKALAMDAMSLKNFRIEVFRAASSQKPLVSRPRGASISQGINPLVDVPTPIRGHRSHIPDDCVRFDVSLFHAPVYTSRQTSIK
ncbi:piggyBac transposable element-derived protein 3-like isoform X4 [Sphaeramia orbicularis]|uniref:piggyBac transposable element-derived protein 3-like isoform X4 n=1 Tax=Sphaeramia orbicularis TaxID=375764 RepID=UPI00117D25B4|nr:piggyBac transposable element-derived protein 3-like isoform X4 [Sphaeramia orbicularis]